MQLLADENIQEPTLRFLRGQGWDVLGAVEEGLASSPDQAIFEHAQRRQRVLLTYDVHFADLRELSVRPHAGIIRLRFSNQRAQFVHPRLLAALERLRSRDMRNTLVTLTDQLTRLRKTLSPFVGPTP